MSVGAGKDRCEREKGCGLMCEEEVRAEQEAEEVVERARKRSTVRSDRRTRPDMTLRSAGAYGMRVDVNGPGDRPTHHVQRTESWTLGRKKILEVA